MYLVKQRFLCQPVKALIEGAFWFRWLKSSKLPRLYEWNETMAELLCDLVLVTRSDVISPVPDLRSEVTRHEWINNDALTSSFVSFLRDWSCTFQSLQTLLVSLVSILCTHNSFQVLVSLKNVKPPRFARRESWQVQVRHRSRWDLHRRLLRMSQRRSKSDEAAVSWSCISWCT